MNTGKILTLLFGVSIVIIAVIGITMHFTYENKYVTLTNLYSAQVEVDKAIFDETWKVIQTQAEVSDQYATKFKENYQAIMSSRNYGGELMKWVTESNPNFSPELYSKLMNTIESLRARFTTNQQHLIAIHKEIKDLTMLWPSSMFVGGKTVPDLVVITSEKTDTIFRSGQENDVKLYSK